MNDLHKALIAFGIGIVSLIGVMVVIKQPTPPSNTQANFTPPIGMSVQATEENKNNDIARIHSPDGTMELMMVRVSMGADTTKYTVFSSKVGEKGKKLYETTLPSDAQIRLPANAWSPDNAYVFILKQDRDGLTAFVFQAAGEVFGPDELYIDVGHFFKGASTEFTLRDVTGWDANDLLHIFTYKEGNAKGPAYWFVIGTREFIQLWH